MAGQTVTLDLKQYREFLARKRAEVEEWPTWKQEAAASYFAPTPQRSEGVAQHRDRQREESK